MTKTVVGSNLARNHGQELSFVLPLTEVSSFPVLFKKVDEFILIHFQIQDFLEDRGRHISGGRPRDKQLRSVHDNPGGGVPQNR